MAQAPGLGDYQSEVSQLDLPRKPIPYRQTDNSIASALNAVSNVVQQRQAADEAKLKADETTAAANTLSDLQVSTLQLMKNKQANAGPGAAGFTPDVLSDFDKQADQVAAQYQNSKYASPLVQAGIRNIRTNLAEHAINFESQAGIAYRSSSIDTNLQNAGTVLQQDPSRLEEQTALMVKQISDAGIGPEQSLEKMRTMEAKLPYYAAVGLTDQNPRAVYDALKNNDSSDPVISKVTDPAARDRLLQYATGKVSAQTGDGIVNTYRALGPTAGAQAFASIDKSDLPDDLKAQIRQHVQTGLAQWSYEARQTNAKEIIPLEEGIASGQPPANARAQVWDLHNKGVYSPEETASKLGALDNIAKSQAADQANLEWARNVYANRTPLDPENKDNKTAMSGLFDTLVKGNGLTPGTSEYTNLAADIAKSTNVAPASAVSWARATVIGGNPDQAAKAADLIARLHEANPRSVGFAVDEKTDAVSRQIVDAVKAGVPAADAVTMARQNGDMGTGQRKQLDELWRQKFPEKTADAMGASALHSALKAYPQYKDGMFTGVPDVPPAMTAEFNTLTHDYFQYTGGDLTKAQQLAADAMTRTWGVTQVNGKRELMKYAPEVMFPGLTADAIRSDLADTLKKNSLTNGGLDTSKYALQPNNPAANPTGWDKRADGSSKGNGFLGLLQRPDGGVSSEISIGIDINGKEREIPTMVPTLSQDQLDWLMTHDVAHEQIPRPIVQKAVDFARGRLAAGKDPFAGPGEQQTGKPNTIDPNKVRLIPTDETERTQGRVFSLAAPDKFGAYDVVTGPDHQPLRYALPVTSADQEALRQRMADEAIAKARVVQRQQQEAERAMTDALDQERRLGFAMRTR
jgi:hypothetical protein